MKTFRAATFNAGLAVGVIPHAAERAPRVAEALASLDVDLLFVQEVWLDPHWEELIGRARDRFRYTFRPDPTGRANATCTDAELEPLVACATTHCDGLRDGRLGECVIRRCKSAAMSMSADCLSCVLQHPLGSIEEILAPCRGAEAPVSRRTEVVAYGGSHGTGFLSRLPLQDVDVLPFPSTLNARSALFARIETEAFGRVHVFGTHLSPGIEYEQRAQIAALLEWIDAKGKDVPTLVLGDLNTQVGSRLYASFEAAGFANAYANAPQAKATFGWGSYIIDHILRRNLDGHAFAERILDEPIEITAEGRRISTTYSDHFGVQLTLAAR